MNAKTIAAIALAVTFALAAGSLLLRHIKPLVPSSALYVTYAENEDFKDNARVYKPFLRRNIYYLHLPAARPEYRWWVINFSAATILTPNPPRFLFFIPYVSRAESRGVPLVQSAEAQEWFWQFTGQEASFTGNGFTCSVRRVE